MGTIAEAEEWTQKWTQWGLARSRGRSRGQVIDLFTKKSKTSYLCIRL